MATDRLKSALKKLATMNACDPFIWAKLMMDPDICKDVLTVLTGIEIDEITDLHLEETIKLFVESRGIRLDVKVLSNRGDVFDAEMQKYDDDLPERSRYYQGVMDSNSLPAGKEFDYCDLPTTYILFICTFDPFGKGLHKYTFENTCLEIPGLKLNDRGVKIFYNTTSTLDDVDLEMREILQYFTDSSDEYAAKSQSDLIKRMHERMREIRVDEMVGREIMTLEEMNYRNRKEAFQEGVQKGIQKGIQEGDLSRLTTLVQKKIAKGLSLEQIADVLETTVDEIAPIYNELINKQ